MRGAAVVVPGWIEGLDDYWLWLEEVLEGSGGYLHDDSLAVDLISDGDEGLPVALVVHKHRLQYHDGSYLDFHLSVGSDLEPIAYSFHYARSDNKIVWRLDKHRGHEAEDGTDTHAHRDDGGGGEYREPHGVVDLGDAIELIRKDQLDR